MKFLDVFKRRVSYAAGQSNMEINAERDTTYAHKHPTLDNVLHVFHLNWHGIRNATAALPGWKLGIDPDIALNNKQIADVCNLIQANNIQAIFFQGYSFQAARLAEFLRHCFGAKLFLCNVSHVTASQLKFHFEIQMIELINKHIETNVLNAHFSVKPNANDFSRHCSKNLIYNCAPNLSYCNEKFHGGRVFIPVENIFRKNLFTNVIAAISSSHTSVVQVVNDPSFLSTICDVRKVERIPFQDRSKLFDKLRTSDLVMNVSFAECQPMTHLEALACGTPCLTGPLGLPDLSNHQLSELTVIQNVDDTTVIRNSIDKILQIQKSDFKYLQDLMLSYCQLANELSFMSYEKALSDGN